MIMLLWMRLTRLSLWGNVKGLYSRKKDIKFDADLVLGVEDGKARFSLEFPKKKPDKKKK